MYLLYIACGWQYTEGIVCKSCFRLAGFTNMSQCAVYQMIVLLYRRETDRRNLSLNTSVATNSITTVRFAMTVEFSSPSIARRQSELRYIDDSYHRLLDKSPACPGPNSNEHVGGYCSIEVLTAAYCPRFGKMKKTV